MTPAGQQLIDAAKSTGVWDSPVQREKNPECPEDLVIALSACGNALANFNIMAPSYRRNYILWITDAKKPETRQRRIQVTVQRCELNLKPELL